MHWEMLKTICIAFIIAIAHCILHMAQVKGNNSKSFFVVFCSRTLNAILFKQNKDEVRKINSIKSFSH